MVSLGFGADGKLQVQLRRQAGERSRAGELWQEHGLVFTTTVGTPYESHNLRRDFRKVTAAAGLGARWVPKELRTSFVSMMSYQGVPVEEIARLAGHASSRTTEVVYRRELRPVITTGAEIMDQIFQPRQRRGTRAEAADEQQTDRVMPTGEWFTRSVLLSTRSGRSASPAGG